MPSAASVLTTLAIATTNTCSPEAAGDDIDDSSDGDDSDDSDDDDDSDCSDQKLNERHSKNQKPPSMAFLCQVWSF
jgi:hypothetical protein